ncbi:MAG: helix-turn-helix transcriptional regulator [Firmicutes bacterium]|nr:helix-turn-helix transcriptional regulator [Bacillota bacterium]
MSNEMSERIRLLREHFGYSQKYAAEQLNISPQAYSHYENNRRIPDVDMLYKLSIFYGVSMEFLVTGQKEELTPIQALLKRDVQSLTDQEISQLRIFVEFIKFHRPRSSNS